VFQRLAADLIAKKLCLGPILGGPPLR
jgi:hypothetical protein